MTVIIKPRNKYGEKGGKKVRWKESKVAIWEPPKTKWPSIRRKLTFITYSQLDLSYLTFINGYKVLSVYLKYEFCTFVGSKLIKMFNLNFIIKFLFGGNHDRLF